MFFPCKFMIYKHSNNKLGNFFILMPTEVASFSCILEKTMYLVFLIFIESLFTQNQVYNLLSSLFVSLYSLAIFLSEVKIVVSSAKSTYFKIIETLQISFIKITNNNGPNIDPCLYSSEVLTFQIPHIAFLHLGSFIPIIYVVIRNLMMKI